MEKHTDIIYNKLKQLNDKCNDLSFDIKYNQDKIKLSDIFNFPDEVSDIIIEILSELDYISDDNNTTENRADAEICQESVIKPIVLDIKIDYDSLEDYSFQYTNTDLSDKLELPKEYQGKIFAMRKYKSLIKYADSNNMIYTKPHDFYELCLDPGKESKMSSYDCWCAVNNEDIVFRNSHCNIYTIKY